MSDRATAPGRSQSLRLCVVLTVVSLTLVFGLTLCPVDGPGPSGFQWRLFSGESDVADLISNVLLFAPLAAAIRCSGVGAWPTMVIGLAISATIEFAQLRVIPGRDASLSDLLSNTLGAAIGAWFAAWLPVRRRSALRGVGAALGSVGIIAVAGLLAWPSLPPTRYYGQWTANLGQYEWYRGRVLSAEIGGMPLPSWRLDDTRKVRARLLAGVPLRVVAFAGPRTGKVAPLFSIADNEGRGIFLVGADGDDLVLHVRSLAEGLLLRATDLRWPRALRGVAPGNSLAVTVRRDATGYCAAVNGRERCGFAHTAGEAWSLLQSYPRLAPLAQALFAVVTMFLLGLPVGLVTARRGWGWAGLGVALGGAVAVPLFVGLAPTPLLQLGGLALGVAAGTRVP